MFGRKFADAKTTYHGVKEDVNDLREGVKSVKSVKDNLVENKDKYIFGAACLAAGFLLGSKTSRPVVNKTYVVLSSAAA